MKNSNLAPIVALLVASQVARAIEAIKNLAQSRMVDLTEIIARG